MYSKERPLLMIPGPVESDKTILEELGSRTLAHNEDYFIQTFREALNNLLKVFQADNSYSPVIVSGAGTLAMEMAMINIIDKSRSEKLLICDTGYFGNRFTQIADAYGIEYDVLSSNPGNRISADDLQNKLETGLYSASFIQHVDTSTGVCNDINAFSEQCSKNDVLSVVDGVCAAGGIPVNQKSNQIDIYFTGAQKALAVPPSLSIMVFSEKAKSKSLNRKSKIQSYYADLDNWWDIFDAYRENTVKYFSTPATNSIAALSTSLKGILDEGLDNRFNRHASISSYFREEMRKLGFDFLTSQDSYANTLSTPKFREGEDRSILSRIKDQGILIAGGIQSGLRDSYFRVGHMGEITKDQIEFLLQTIKSLN